MIKGLMGGTNVVVSNGGSSYPYISGNMNNPMTGMIRLSGQDFQVFDGTTWITLGGSYSQVDLSADAQSLLQWAKQERDKQLKREQLIKDNPALQKAFEAIQRAEANFDLLKKFVEHDHDNAGQVQSSP